jgi:hypothetical protein
MNANGSQGVTTHTGVVKAVNDKGIRLEGELEWRNYSKWAEAFDPPTPGQSVAVKLDGKGFVRDVAVLDSPTDAPQTHEASRETAIIRQTCLKASAAFCASRIDLKSADLFALAERMEKWVLRDGEG